MVDFQARDTRRDLGESESDSSEDTPGADTDESDTELPQTLGLGFLVVNDEASGTGDIDLEELVEAIGGVTEATREFIEPKFDGVQGRVSRMIKREDVHALVVHGGTGVRPDAVTPSAVEPLIDQKLPGFGQLVRSLAADRAGTEVVRMRPLAGVINGIAVFCLPDQPWAATLAADEILSAELRPIVRDVRD